MAPRPSYQLLIWSVPTVALLLTCLWYRRKRNSLRSDPGGTASVDLTALPLKRPDLGKEPTTVQSGSRVEKSAQPVEALEERASTFAANAECKEVDSTEDSCRKIEADHSVASIPNHFIPVNHSDLRAKSSVQEPSCIETQQVIEEFKKCQEETDRRVLNFEEEKREEGKCKGKSEGEFEYEEEKTSEEIERKEEKRVAETECKEENCVEETECKENCVEETECKENCVEETECKENCDKESEHTENCEIKSEHTENCEIKSEHTENCEIKSEHTENCESKSEHTENCESKSEHTENCESKSEHTENCESKSEHTENCESKSEHTENSDRESEQIENCASKSECKENCEKESKENCINESEYKENCIKESECKESCIKESECKENSVKEIDYEENCETESECKEETPSFCEKERLAETTSVNVHVLSGVSEDISDKSRDILNFHLVEELDSSTEPSSGFVLISDSILPAQLAEEKYISSSDQCVVINSAEPESVEKGSESTVSRPALCEGCSVVSDSAATKQQFEICAEETFAASAVNAGESSNEASCVGNVVTSARTVMARKSSTDLSMERSADSDGTAANRDCKLSESEHKGNGAESVQVERDSANHSPADVMLGSPAISNYSDANSEGSSDSGKGCSDMATPPPRTPASGSSLAGDVPSIYEFVLPQHLVGRLIGRYGVFIHQIHDKANANVIIKKHPDTTKLKICAIEGNQMSIDRALEMIRDKFPLKKYPNVTLEQVFFVPATPVFPLPQCVQLRLVEGVNNDVIVSYMVTPAHVFLQQPTHPTFLNLNAQAAYMQACYSEPTVPALPRPVAANVVCVAPVMGDWCRAQVVTDEAEDGSCTVRLLDYGGYADVDCSVLRQIRQDFMLLPFQAAEAYLANVIPAGGVEEEWSQEAFDVLEELTKRQVVEAQVVGYADNSIPVVYLYSIVRSKPILVNYELVKRGFAQWTEVCAITNGNEIATNGDVAEDCDRAVPAEQ